LRFFKLDDIDSVILTWFVLDGGNILWKQFSLELPVVLVLAQPASMRKEPLLTQRRTVDLDVIQQPRPSAAGVVVTDSTLKSKYTIQYNTRLLWLDRTQAIQNNYARHYSDT